MTEISLKLELLNTYRHKFGEDFREIRNKIEIGDLSKLNLNKFEQILKERNKYLQGILDSQ